MATRHAVDKARPAPLADAWGRRIPTESEQMLHDSIAQKPANPDRAHVVIHGALSYAKPATTNRTTALTSARLSVAAGERIATVALTGMFLYLFALPLFDQRVGMQTTWIIYGAFVGTSLIRLPHARGRGAWIVAVAALPWAAWALSWPSWSAWAPDSRAVRAEQLSLLASFLLCFASITLAAGSRRGAQLHRRAWIAVGVAAIPIGLWEVLTQQHLYPGTWMPPPWSAAATFANPNSFAVILLVVYGLLLLRLTERITTVERVAYTALAAASALLIFATLSRLTVAAGLVVTCGAAALEAHRRGLLHRRPTRGTSWKTPAAAIALIVLFTASMTIPAWRRINPLARFLFPEDDATARADGLRVTLIRHGLQMWREDPWRGIGAGRFEALLKQRGGGERVIPMHNGFVEILTEYGLVVAIPLAAWVLALAWCAISTRTATDAGVAGRPRGLDRAGARYAIGLWLIAFIVTGQLVSSPLLWHFWYLMAASATATAWWLCSTRPAPAHGDQADLVR